MSSGGRGRRRGGEEKGRRECLRRERESRLSPLLSVLLLGMAVVVEGGVGGGGAKGRIIAGAKGRRGGGGSRGGTTTQELEGVVEFLRASLACDATRRRGCSCGCRHGPHSRVVSALFLALGDSASWGLGGRGHVEEEWGEGRKTRREAAIVAAGAEGAASAAAAAAGLVAVRCCVRWGGLRLWGRHGRVVCLALHWKDDRGRDVGRL